MYNSGNINDMGRRIAAMRRDRGLTQEEFARMIGVSPQAVSKWETGAGFPDIMTIPLIADTLNTTVDELFGRPSKAKPQDASAFPEELDGVPLAGTFRDAACYSEAPKKSQHGPIIELGDGSSVNLATGEIKNTGGNQIHIHYPDDEPLDMDTEDQDGDPEDTAETGSASDQNVRSFSFDLKTPTEISILYDKDASHLKWNANGSPLFMKNLTIEQKGDTLFVTSNQETRSPGSFKLFSFSGSGSRCKGSVEITVPFPKGKNLMFKSASSSALDTEIDFETSNISIAGTGEVTACDLGEANLSIAGSGEIDADSARNAQIKIAGSGDITIDKISDNLSASVAGSGDIEIENGAIDLLELSIAGSGDFAARNVEAERAVIRLIGSGDAVIGRIRGESQERIARGSSLRVLRRG